MHATTTKKTSFKSFHANFLKTNFYHYCRESSMKHINKFMQLPIKKLVSTLFFLIITWKPMFITTSETHLSNLYNKFMQLHKKKLVSSLFMVISCISMSITIIETHLSNLTINSCNYHKKTSFISFHANFLKTNVYHYFRDSSIKYINKFMQVPLKN